MQEDSEMTTEISQFLVFMSSPNSQAMPISAAGIHRHILRKLLKFNVPRASGLVPAIHGLRNPHSPQISTPPRNTSLTGSSQSKEPLLYLTSAPAQLRIVVKSSRKEVRALSVCRGNGILKKFSKRPGRNKALKTT